MSIFKSIAKAAKSVIKSPITKVVAGGLAVAFPVVGVPAAAGIAISGKIVDAAQRKTGTPAQQATARRIVQNTATAAAKGDADAKRAWEAMKKAQQAKALAMAMRPRNAPPPAPRLEPGWHINRQGRFRKVA